MCKEKLPDAYISGIVRGLPTWWYWFYRCGVYV